MANNTLKNIASFAIGYSLSKYNEKRKIHKASLAEYIERYVKENKCDYHEVAAILFDLAEDYDVRDINEDNN